jgi:hypothetical protein
MSWLTSTRDCISWKNVFALASFIVSAKPTLLNGRYV